MQTVSSADGTRIAYETHGEGPPLLLLHGGGTRRYWDPVVPHFEDDHTVVVPDRRGRGDSGDGDAYSLDLAVADTRAVVDAVDGDPVLFGHSFGGLRAIETARVAPVEAVVAYEPAVLVGDYRDEADLVARMEERLDDGDRRGAMRLHLREVLHGGDIGDEAFERWLDEWPAWPGYADFVETTLRMNRVIEAYRLPETLEVDAPALLLTGSEGPAHLRDSVRAVRDAVPDGRLVEFDGLGHNAPASAPERVAETVREFLERVDGR
ncbi:alpha/beta fold hydrolase [Halostella salina]|uniref:alpha/beta fold hydrolase n=1 Tax=Halostella salina TaxID=1547897 RepID=UPI000EF81668|nr:alpha/beta hydrolase [Halostella salina]